MRDSHLVLAFEDANRTPYVLTLGAAQAVKVTATLSAADKTAFDRMDQFEGHVYLPPQGRSHSIFSDSSLPSAAITALAGNAYATLNQLAPRLAEKLRFMRARFMLVSSNVIKQRLLKDERTQELANSLDLLIQSHCYVDLGRLDKSQIDELIQRTQLQVVSIEYAKPVANDRTLGALCSALYRAIGIFPAELFEDQVTGILGAAVGVRKHPRAQVQYEKNDRSVVNPISMDVADSRRGFVRPHTVPHGVFLSSDPADRDIKWLPILDAVQIKVLKNGVVTSLRDMQLADQTSIYNSNCFSYRAAEGVATERFSDYGGKPIPSFAKLPVKSLKLALRVYGLTPDVSLKELIVLLAIRYKIEKKIDLKRPLELTDPEFIAFLLQCCEQDELLVPIDALVKLGADEAPEQRARPKSPTEPREFSAFSHLREAGPFLVYPKMNPYYAQLVQARFQALIADKPKFTDQDLAILTAEKSHAWGNEKPRSYKHAGTLLGLPYVGSRYTRSVKSAADLQRIYEAEVSRIKRLPGSDDTRRLQTNLAERLKEDLKFAAMYGSKPGTLGIHNEALLLHLPTRSAHSIEVIGTRYEDQEDLEKYGKNQPSYYYLIHPDGLPSPYLAVDTPAIKRVEDLVAKLFPQVINIAGERYPFKFKIWNGRCAIIVEPTVPERYIKRQLADQLLSHSCLTHFNDYLTSRPEFSRYVEEYLYVRAKRGLTSADRRTKELDSFTVQVTLRGGPERFEKVLMAYEQHLALQPIRQSASAELGMDKSGRLMRWPSSYFLGYCESDDALFNELDRLIRAGEIRRLQDGEMSNFDTIFHLIFRLKAVKSLDLLLRHLNDLPQDFLTQCLASMNCVGRTPLSLLFEKIGSKQTGECVLAMFNMVLPYMLTENSPAKQLTAEMKEEDYLFEFKPEFRLITSCVMPERLTRRDVKVYVADYLVTFSLERDYCLTGEFSEKPLILFQFLRHCSRNCGAFSFDEKTFYPKRIVSESEAIKYPDDFGSHLTGVEIDEARTQLLSDQSLANLPVVASPQEQLREREEKRKAAAAEAEKKAAAAEAEKKAAEERAKRASEESRLAEQRRLEQVAAGQRRELQRQLDAQRAAEELEARRRRAREEQKASSVLLLVKKAYFGDSQIPAGSDDSAIYKSAFMLELIKQLSGLHDQPVTLELLARSFGRPVKPGFFSMPDARNSFNRQAALVAASEKREYRSFLTSTHRTDHALVVMIEKLSGLEAMLRP